MPPKRPSTSAKSKYTQTPINDEDYQLLFTAMHHNTNVSRTLNQSKEEKVKSGRVYKKIHSIFGKNRETMAAKGKNLYTTKNVFVPHLGYNQDRILWNDTIVPKVSETRIIVKFYQDTKSGCYNKNRCVEFISKDYSGFTVNNVPSDMFTYRRVGGHGCVVSTTGINLENLKMVNVNSEGINSLKVKNIEDRQRISILESKVSAILEKSTYSNALQPPVHTSQITLENQASTSDSSILYYQVPTGGACHNSQQQFGSEHYPKNVIINSQQIHKPQYHSMHYPEVELQDRVSVTEKQTGTGYFMRFLQSEENDETNSNILEQVLVMNGILEQPTPHAVSTCCNPQYVITNLDSNNLIVSIPEPDPVQTVEINDTAESEMHNEITTITTLNEPNISSQSDPEPASQSPVQPKSPTQSQLFDTPVYFNLQSLPRYQPSTIDQVLFDMDLKSSGVEPLLEWSDVIPDVDIGCTVEIETTTTHPQATEPRDLHTPPIDLEVIKGSSEKQDTLADKNIAEHIGPTVLQQEATHAMGNAELNALYEMCHAPRPSPTVEQPPLANFVASTLQQVDEQHILRESTRQTLSPGDVPPESGQETQIRSPASVNSAYVHLPSNIPDIIMLNGTMYLLQNGVASNLYP